MKEILIDTLSELMLRTNTNVPLTQPEVKRIDVSDIKPIDLSTFMAENDIPNTADFDGEDNSYDGWEIGVIYLIWSVDVPIKEKTKQQVITKRFNVNAFSNVSRALKANGYIRSGTFSNGYKDFKDTTVYDMYINKEYDKLVKYFSLVFKKG